MSLETSIDALTAVCCEILAELRSHKTHTQVCEATLVEIDQTPAEQTTEPTPAPAEVPAPSPAPAECADVMSEDEYNAIAFAASREMKDAYGAAANAKLKEILAPYNAKALGLIAAEHRRDVIAAINNALAEAEHGR